MKIELTEAQIKKMVDRFLGWRLPEPFRPDAGISFKPEYNIEYMAKQGKPPMRYEPTGTNLFDADQAREMILHIFGAVGTAEDLSKCPQCGGEADNGHDRCIPPSAYMCSKCSAQEEAERAYSMTPN